MYLRRAAEVEKNKLKVSKAQVIIQQCNDPCSSLFCTWIIDILTC